jgi:type II secretory pathway component PulF
MKNFVYRAYDEQSAKIGGELEASSVEGARAILRQSGFMVISIREKKLGGQASTLFSRVSVTTDELEYFTSELSLLLNAGVTIDRGLSVIKRNAASIPQAKLIGDLFDDVRKGHSLSSAMESQGQVFSPLYINLVELGESTGKLPAVFSRLAEDIKFQSELKRKIIQSLTYPAAIFAVCILSIIFIFNYIVPQMGGLFAGMPEIPVYTAILLGLSGWMIEYQWFLLLGIMIAVGGIIFAIRTSSGARKLDAFMLFVPGIKSVCILSERIRFNTAVAMMLQSGIMIDQCLEMAVGSVNNKILKQDLVIATERVKKGETLSRSLRSSALFPDFLLSLLEVGEESGQLEPVFNEISSRARREFESWIARVTSLLEPALILIMGFIVGGVVVTMLLSIVSVNDVGI